MQSNFFNWLKRSYIFIVLAVIYIPLIILVIWSFAAPSDKGNVTTDWENNGFGNYIDLFQNNDFLNGLMNSFIIMGITTPISVFIATITCYAIWKSNLTMRATTLGMARVSLVNPEIITGISLALLFSSTWISLGFDFGFFTVVLSHISFCTPYAIITIYPRMLKFNKNLLDASRDLGYNSFLTFFKIVVPYLLPSIIGAAALVAIMSFDDFIITNLVRGRVTTVSTEMYMMAKGIKTWAVTFGAFLVLGFGAFITIKMILNKRKEKKKQMKINSNLFKHGGRNEKSTIR
ncbi:MAG: ABC transporter permease [Mycoplasma sp.]